jgi:hypothetical protein
MEAQALVSSVAASSTAQRDRAVRFDLIFSNPVSVKQYRTV